MKRILVLLLVIVPVLMAGFVEFYIGREHSCAYSFPRKYIVRASTTTLYQIRVVGNLLGDFNNVTGMNVDFEVLAKGSGEALRLLADGYTCVAFVHASSLELDYLRRGVITKLTIFAYNEFAVVGPASDPANVSSAEDSIEAFKRIYSADEKELAKFISRGNYSETHVRELQIWSLTGLNPEGRKWYLKSGQGMTQTLIMAENLNAYTLTNIGAFLSLVNQGKVKNLVVLKKDPQYLINVYSAYLSLSSACDNPYTWYVAYKLKDYLMNWSQELLELKYKGLLNPVKGSEELVESAWEALAKLG